MSIVVYKCPKRTKEEKIQGNKLINKIDELEIDLTNKQPRPTSITVIFSFLISNEIVFEIRDNEGGKVDFKCEYKYSYFINILN